MHTACFWSIDNNNTSCSWRSHGLRDIIRVVTSQIGFQSAVVAKYVMLIIVLHTEFSAMTSTFYLFVKDGKDGSAWDEIRVHFPSHQ